MPSFDKNAAVAASTPVSLAAAVYKKKNIVDCFVFFCGPSEQALYLPCKENKDYWSLERWTSEIPVIKIRAARLHARLDIHCSVFINIFPSLNFQHRNAAAFFLGS